MAILDWFGISTALAQTATTAPAHTQSPAAGFLSMLPMLVIIVAVFYFLFVRPQAKRAKEQRSMLDSLNIGDEVVTIGGIVGKVTKLRDNYVVISVGNSDMTLQKSAVASILPKGTMETLN